MIPSFENLRGPLWAALRRGNDRRALPLEIACVGEEIDLPLGMSDPELLLWAEQQGFVLISNDARTMPGHFAAHLGAGHHSQGVFLIALPVSISEIVEALYLDVKGTQVSDAGIQKLKQMFPNLSIDP